MDDEEPGAGRAARGDPVAEKPVSGACALALGGHAQEPARLVDDQDVLVLVHKAEWLGAGRRRRRRELDAVIGAHRRVAPAHHGAVDAHARGRKPLLQTSTRGVGIERLQSLAEPHAPTVAGDGAISFLTPSDTPSLRHCQSAARNSKGSSKSQWLSPGSMDAPLRLPGRCSHDDLSVRRVLDAGSLAHLRGRAIQLPRDGAPALEVLPLRALALARAGGGRSSEPARAARGQNGLVKTASRGVFRFGRDGDASDNAEVVEPRRVSASQPRGRILVVDDEPDLVTILTKYFTDAGYTVDAASHGGDALIAVSQYQPDVVVLDVMMEGLDGVQVLQRIRSLDPAIRVIMITGSNDASLKPTTMSMGAFAYVSKPVSLQHLHDAVSAAFTRPN